MDYISIDNFDGSLDLLLHLVKESNIDILDIKIEEITDKYLDYINYEDNLNINISSSYLVMAAELIYLKSKSLLPKVDKEEDNEEEITRESLINKLLDYKKYKEMTPTFRELEEKRREVYVKSPEKTDNYVDNTITGEGNIDSLLDAFKKFLERKDMEKPLVTTVTSREYSVRDRKNSIKNVLVNKKKAYLDDLIDEYIKPYLVVTFLSVLEMAKEKEIVIKQDNNFDKILIELKEC